MIVGEAKVVIRAIGDKLESDIQKSLDRAGLKAGKSGDKAGQNYIDGVVQAVNRDRSKIEKPVSDALSRAGTIGGRNAGRRIAEEVTKGTTDGVRKAARPVEDMGERIGRRVGDRVSRGFQRSRFTRIMGSALVKLGIFIPVIGAIVGGLSALISGLYALVAALGTAAAASVALVGVLGAGIQAIGVFVVGMRGVGKAISEGLKPDNAEKFQEALKKIAPAARPFVKEFVKLKDDFTELRNAAARGLFPGLETALSRIAPLLPRMAQGFEDSGRAAGRATDNFVRIVTHHEALRNFSDLAASNNVLIEKFGNILGDLARTLIALLDAASPLTERFTSWLERGSESLRKMTEEGNRTGRLTRYLEKAGDVAALFGDILGNIFEGLYDIGRIAQPVGVDLLEAFEDSTAKLRDFTDSAENVQKTQKYFEDVKVNVLAISGLVKELGKAFIRMGAAPGVKATADALKKIVPDLEEALTKSIEEIGPAIAELVGEILKLFTTLEESGAIRAVIDIFTKLSKALVFLFNIPGVGAGLLWMLKFVAIMKSLQLIMKGGGLFFNGLVKSYISLRNIAQITLHPIRSLHGLSLVMRQSIANAAISVGLLASSMLGLSTNANAAATSTAKMSTAQRLIASNAASGVGVIGQRGRAMDDLATKTDKATKASGKFSKFLPSFSRVGMGVGIAGLALSMSGLADKVGLNNAAMGAAVGMMYGPLGAAVGATGGLFIDLTKKINTTSQAMKNAFSGAETALATDDITAMRSAFYELENQIDTLKDKQSDLNPFNNGGMFDTQKAQVYQDQLRQKIDDTIEAQRAQFREAQRLRDVGSTDIDVVISAKSSVASLKDYFSSLQEEGEKFKLRFSDDIGSNLISQLRSVGRAAGEAGGPALEDFNKTVEKIGRTSGISAEQSRVLANILSGAGDVLEGIPKDTKIKVDGEFGNILQELGVADSVINDITNRDKTIEIISNIPEMFPLFGELTRTVDEIPDVKDMKLIPSVLNKPAVDALSESINGLPSAVSPDVAAKVKGKSDVDALNSSINNSKSRSVTLTATVKASLQKGSKAILDLVGFNWGGKRATGGWVFGPGTSTSDSILTMLSNGEYVVRAVQAKKFGPLLEAINDNKPLPKPLPDMSSATANIKPSSTPSGGGQQYIVGELRLVDGRAYISGVAQDMYDSNVRYEKTVKGM